MNRVVKLLDKLTGGSAAKEIRAVQARYEAAYWNQGRSYIPGFIQSAREDINTMSRQELLRRLRYFEKNSPVLLKILSILNTNVIGSGISPTSAAEDEGWGKEALAWWNEWVPVADITGASNAYGLQSIGYRAQKVDGDSFIHMRMSPVNRPALEIVEADRCVSLAGDINRLQQNGFRVFDGVIVDAYGRPAAYLFADDFDHSVVSPVMASYVVPLFAKDRAGQVRGISPFHAAILDLHDLDDLQKYEMRAAKDAAAISRTIETAAAGFTVDGDNMGAPLTPLPNTNPAERNQYYKGALAGEVLPLQPGDKMQQYESKRPSAATSGFWDRLDNKIVQGSGISYAALMDYRGNWGGATLRAALQSDNRLFTLETAAQARAWQRVWEFAIGWAVQAGELSPNPDWKKVRWHPPRRTTVDIGNDSQAMLDELKGGLRTYETIYGENGEDYRERLEQRASEEALLDALAKKYNVPVARIASFAQERLAGQAPDAVAPLPAGPGGAPQPGQRQGGGNGQ